MSQFVYRLIGAQSNLIIKKAHHSHTLFPLIPHFLPYTLLLLPSSLQNWTENIVGAALDDAFSYLADSACHLTRFSCCNRQISVNLFSEVLILCLIGLSETGNLFLAGFGIVIGICGAD